MNKQNQNDQNKDWSKQQKGSNEGMSGSTKQDQSSNKSWDKDANKQSGNQGQQPRKEEPVEERSPKASGNREQDKKAGENRDPEINMPSNEPEKTEKKIPNYE
jgi:hypothetical protein